MNTISSIRNSKSSKTKPIKVLLKRGSSVESVHIVHAVVCDSKGRILMNAGDANYLSFIRSALKPFQALPFISSGTSEKIDCGKKGLAIATGSHDGTPVQAREAFKLLWNSEIDVSKLQCPIPKGKKSKLEHNCSGKHSAFLATCKKMNWPLTNYLKGDHPLQVEIFRRVAEILGIPAEELVAERDDCGAPTLLLQLAQMGLLYAHLGSSNQAEFENICRSMIAYPDLVAGLGRFDTEVLQRAHGQLISKGGAEGIQCIS